MAAWKYRNCIGLLAALPGLWLSGCGSGGDDSESVNQQVSIELIPYARLTASATRNFVPGWSKPRLWPEDLLSGVMTVRDDDPETSWEAPLTEAASIEIDLAPLYSAPLPLEQLTIQTAGSGSAQIEVSLSKYCGGRDLSRLQLEPLGQALLLEGVSARCVTLHILPLGDFRITKISLLGKAAEPSRRQTSPAVSTHRGYGVIEGFYGTAWNWRERSNILRAMAATGLDTYIYAPKSDPLHRSNWREPYSEEFINHFRELDQLGKSLGVRVYFGVSPFRDIDYSDMADRQLLLEKLTRVIDLGVNSIMLLADDTGVKPNTALGQNHAEFVSDIYDELRALQPDLHLIFVPTVYHQEYADLLADGWGYLQAIAALPADIDIAWTGSDTYSPEMTSAGLRDVAAVIGRKPYIWDNFYANDHNTGRIRLDPLSGRSSDIQSYVSGYVINPMNQGGLSRWVTNYLGWALCELPGTCGSPVHYAASAEALMGVDLSHDTELDAQILAQVATMFSANRGQTNLMRFKGLDETVETLAADIVDRGRPSDQTINQLQMQLRTMVGLWSEVHHSRLDPDLVDELHFPLQSVRAVGKAGLAILDLLRMRLSGDDAFRQVAHVETLIADLDSYRYTVNPGSMDELFALVQSVTPDNNVAWADDIPLSGIDVPCVAGEPFTWSMIGDDWTVGVSGLPGAYVEDDLVTWMPVIPGRYAGVITASRVGVSGAMNAWAYKEFKLVCR